ncbi:MAG TPA: hypothetical protein VEU30_00710 [Thermoanaerobaculia bacterium]|nr:hypothetical protein [Thermoanaerobaculia bacterium]
MKRILFLLILLAMPLTAAAATDVQVVSFTLDKATAVTGERIEATLRVRNAGPDAASNVGAFVTMVHGPGIFLPVSGPAGWDCGLPFPYAFAGGCRTTSFAAGQEAEIKAVFLTSSAPSGDSRFEGSVDLPSDAQPANNRLVRTIPVTAAASRADLTVTATPMFSSVPEGGVGVIDVDVRNAGPDAASNVRVAVSANEPVTASGTNWTCSQMTTTSALCTTSSIATGATSRLTMRITAPQREIEIPFSIAAAAERSTDTTPSRDFGSVSVGTAANWHRRLIPVTAYDTFSSPWIVDVTMLIRSDQQLDIRPHPCEFIHITCFVGAPPLRKPFDAYVQTIMPPAEPGEPGAVFVYVRKPDQEKVHVNARVYNTTTQGTTAGSELPIVDNEEFTSGPVDLIGIPLDPVYRQLLRVYDTQESGETTVSIRVYAGAETEPRATLVRTLVRSEYAQLTTTARLWTHPGYAQIDLRELAEAMAGAKTMRIEVIPQSGASRIWAFVTTTNNETQHVTTTTPQ